MSNLGSGLAALLALIVGLGVIERGGLPWYEHVGACWLSAAECGDNRFTGLGVLFSRGGQIQVKR